MAVWGDAIDDFQKTESSASSENQTHLKHIKWAIKPPNAGWLNLKSMTCTCSRVPAPLPSPAVKTCTVEEMTQHRKSPLKPKQGKSGQSWTFLDPPQEGLIWQCWQNSRRLPSRICLQIKTVLKIKGWVSGSSPWPHNASSASLLFLQGRSCPAGSEFAAWFKSRRTRPLLLAPGDRRLSPVSVCKLVPASLASSSFQKK